MLDQHEECMSELLLGVCNIDVMDSRICHLADDIHDLPAIFLSHKLNMTREVGCTTSDVSYILPNPRDERVHIWKGCASYLGAYLGSPSNDPRGKEERQ